MKIINDRYEIIKPLSRDNNWIEYLVSDVQKSGMIKRIRIFDIEMSNFDFIINMEEEFVELKNIVHENLLSVYEFQPIYTINGSRINRKQYFYTYEHYDESRVVHYIDLNKSEVNSVLIQLCKVFRFLHFRGVIYKYLNFDHVLILKDNHKVTVKLKDIANNYVNDYHFKMDHERFNQFIAPEIMWGEEIDLTVDIFSLGILFYYLYYRIDYRLRTISNVVKSSSVNDIHKFILKASSHIKEERHLSINQFIDDISKLIWIEVDHNDFSSYDRIFDHTKIIGRDAILKDIRNLINEKYNKTLNYNAVYIRGESGIGKTRILKEIAQVAKFNRFAYIKLKPKQVENIPFGTVKQILGFVSSHDDVSPQLIQKYGAELSSVLPELQVKWNINPDQIIDVEEQYLRVLNRVFNFFLEYCSDKFILILVDDEEKIDPRERYFYDQLLEHNGVSSYFLIITGSEVKSKENSKNEQLRILKLPSLTLEETGQIVKATLGVNYIPYRLTHRLMLENQGKASITKNMIFKLWQDGYIYFDTKKMQWELDGFDDHFVFEYFEGRKEDYELLLSDLKPKDIENLKRLSILKSSFNMNFVFKFCHMDEETGYAFFSEMEEKKILNKRISDVEYVFVFHDNEFKKVFFDMLSNSEKKVLYKEASNYYEQRFMSSNEVNESIIDYLIQCDDILLAAKYCLIFADHFIESFNNIKASELLNRASDLYEKLDDKNKVIETSLRLIKQLIKVGKLEDAYEKANEIINLSKSYDEISHVDAKLEFSNVLYYKNDMARAFSIAEECIEKSIEINYFDGEFKSAQMLCRCLTNTVELDKHIELTRKYLKKSMESDNEYYQAVFQNELGVNHLYRNNYEESLRAFSESLKCYKNLGDEENIIKSYNNIGVVHFDGFGDYLVARDFFRKAYTHSINRNYVVATPVHLNNLGETYVTEGRYEMAIKYFEESHQIAEKIGDKGVDLLALLNLCNAYHLVEKYGKAYTLMNRLEHEFATLEKRDFNRQDYYLLHLDFFLSMQSIMKVDKWRYEFDDCSIEDDYRKYRINIIDMVLKYKKNDIINEKREVPLKALSELVEKTVKPSEVKLLRTFIMDVLIDLVDRYDYLSAEELFRLDMILAKRYNTKFIRLKNEVIEAALSDFSIERIENLIEPIMSISHEFLWKVYKILGNENFNRNNLYQALKYYLMALDVIYDLSNNVPLEYKETYILYDNSKMSLKNNINKITKRLLSLDGVVQSVIYDERFETVEDFFDLSQLNRLYHSKEFNRLISENNSVGEEVRFETSIDLIRNLEKDEINNLKLILKYLKQLTFAERAFIYLLDENDNISQVIKADDASSDYDVSRLINNIGNDIEGILITKINPKTNIQLLTNNQKSIICFPVYETSSVRNGNDKRKEDLLVTKQKIIGYVFMDSKNLINRFDETTFEQAKSFINLIYVFIDNYNLKRLSTIDKLTGVYLRKFIEQKFALHMSIARQNNYNLSVIMLDIDKFKFVNDTYGHRKGDEILTRLGEILNQSVRSTDYVARYGGEEFIILLPEADSSSGLKVAEKTRMLIETSKLLGDEMPLTVSLGVSTYPKDGANEEELIEKADQALYYSKNNGRNQSTGWDHKLIKERHRYDRLTGILTGNISSDTRTVKALIDILNQLEHCYTREESIRNSFISLLDITEGEEIQFIMFDENQNIKEVIYKKKGQEKISDELVLNDRLINRFKGTNNSNFFIDWEEVIAYDANLKVPNWKSYIIITFLNDTTSGILSIAVDIKDKEFEFSNYNFVDALKPVLEHVLFIQKG